tara:strand:- start:409 stop:591 length:183 start_codon:yes stop_codon:yes gene_type:complete
MKNQIKEGFIDKFFQAIAKGRVDSTMKKLIKQNPELAKNIKKRKEIDNKIDDFLKKQGLM